MATLVFEDRASLRAALESGLIDAKRQGEPAELAISEDGRLHLAVGARLDRETRARLERAGVELGRRMPRGPRRALSCWAEALPPARAPEPEPPLGEVLFVSEGDEGFLRISGELLRLGSEDQRLAFFTDEDGRRRNLCRVADPPYYAVLRALDRDDPLRAYAPVRPGARVWVELGWAHPLAARVEAEAGQLLLIPGPTTGKDRTPEPWLPVPDGPWLDLHALTEVTVPAVHAWTAHEPERRLEVELRLVRAPQLRAPTLWVLRERAVEQIEALVRTVPDSVVARLRFAAVDRPNPETGELEAMIVLRARRSVSGPPSLDLDAEAYVAAAQIPALHLPLASAVDPPLRASKLRELLLDERERVVWLAAQGPEDRRARPFLRESLPESAFAPLASWVDYLVGAHDDQLRPWVESAIFDLDDFVSIGVEWAEGEGPKPKPKPKRDVEDGAERRRRRDPLPPTPAPAELPQDEEDDELQTRPVETPELAPVNLPRSEAELRLAALEQEFCELDTPLDDPGRMARWAELGNLQAGLYRSREAGLCWSRALWEPGLAEGPSSRALAERWAQSEADMLGYPKREQLLGILDILDTDLDEHMVRGLAAAVVMITERWRAAGEDQDEGEPLSGDRLAALQRFFAHHGAVLDLRTLWLARSALAQMAGDDRLALFQTRDLIMSSLREGVGLARNIPAFVRTHGSDGDAGDLGRLADELLQVRDDYLDTPRQRSILEATHREENTHAYVRLIFAWGLARLGRPEDARKELDAARATLGPRIAEPEEPGSDPVHRAAFLAFEARVNQALDGLPSGVPLSAEPGGPIEARERLVDIDRFKYDRLLQHSRVLEPRQEVDAFTRWNDREREPFAGLALLTRPEELAALFDRMLGELEALDAPAQAQALHTIFNYIEALPEPLVVPRLRRALGLLAGLELEARTQVLRHALLLAGYYERSDIVTEILASLDAAQDQLSAEQPVAYAELLDRSAPILRRCGHEARLAAMLESLEQQLGDDNSFETARTGLHIAAGFAALGQPERVQGAFSAAHALLPELHPGDRQILLREIAVALSRSTPGQAIAGAHALMDRLATTTDNMSTNSHYCLAVIQLMEAVVLSLASEDLALSEWARRWVEEDEHLLHRRIHRELAEGAG